MSTPALLGIAAGGIALLLYLIIRLQVHAFVALMLVSLLVAMATSMPVADIVPTMIAGMGGTLGSVAILVALGAMLGRFIEVSGGAAGLAQRFTEILGPKRVPAALTAAAMLLAVPVFFEVGVIILVPIVYGFCKRAGVSPVKYGLPVFAIMLAVHVSVPPHPGIVGAATIIGADVGWITVIGLSICVPLAFLAQFLAKRLNRREFPMQPALAEQFEKFGEDSAESAAAPQVKTPRVGSVLALILVPLSLIMVGNTGATMLPKGDALRNLLSFLGAPIFALMVALGLAYLLIVRQQRWSRVRANEIMESALPSTASMILVMGAGGIFAKVLTGSGIGAALSHSLAATHLPLILLAFVITQALRAAQGSATVAILTTCGLLHEAIAAGAYSPVQTALLAVAIGFGGLGLSHVNDAGFWIVTRYLGLSVGDGLRTWTVLTTLLGLAGFLLTSLLWVLVA